MRATPQSSNVRPNADRRPATTGTARYYRNPGGVGRYAEYYPPGMPLVPGYGRDPVRVATFNGTSGVPTFQDQMMSHQVGVMRYNAIQQSIDRYARPYYGYGFGFGFGNFGGFR